VGNAQNDSAHSKGFFNNKGAVAGVFAVVGLVVVVIAIALVTNAVRRRRAKKFDRDVALAAAEAAANARSPDFGVDDDGYGYGSSSGGAGGDGNRSMYTGYSDASHGTYAQQPLGHGAESYGMTDLHGFDPYVASATTAGAAGIGAAGLNRAKSNTQPYNAFAGPQTDPYAPPVQAMYDAPSQQAQGLRYRQRGASGNSQDLLEAAGLPAGVGAGAGLARGPSKSYAQQQQQAYPQQQGYGAPAQQAYAPQQGYQSSSPPQAAPRPISTATDEDPYDGIDSGPGPTSMPMANPYSPSEPSSTVYHSPRPVSGQYSSDEEGGERYPEPAFGNAGGQGESRVSLRDEEDYAYGGGKRVLKVANE